MRAFSYPVALTSVLLLITACGQGAAPDDSSSTPEGTSVGSSTVTSPPSPSTLAKPAKDVFTSCATPTVTKDAAGYAHCPETRGAVPPGQKSITCLADLGKTPATQARLKVTYSVFRQGRNVAYFRDIDPSRYTVKGFQARFDFTPEDGAFWGDATLPPGGYYCEWATASGSPLGDVELVHGQLPSSSIGTRGAAY